jgi:hypothetical protein
MIQERGEEAILLFPLLQKLYDPFLVKNDLLLFPIVDTIKASRLDPLIYL